MSYLVLIVGLFLAVCGALSISFGYGIVNVERGWSSVIAGAAVLAGGVVTMALGLILHSLGRLRAFLKTEKLARERAARPAWEAGSPGVGIEAPIFADRAEQEATPPIHFEREPEAPLYAEREPDFEAIDEPIIADQRLGPPGAAPAAQISIEDIRRLVAEKARKEPESRSLPQEAADATRTQGRPEVAPVPPVPPRAAPISFGLPRAVDLKDIAPQHFAHGDAGSRSAAAGSREMAPAPREDAPATHNPRADIASPQPLGPEPTQAPLEPPRRQPREGLTVIGRYESEGTAYTMYVDGSIEAHSDRGAFYFLSMAELKAFMDAQARGGL
ncbi:MAG: hypothetical protein WDN46_06335 [Methylocella sp.]